MAYWQFRQLNPNENSGISTVEDNFSNEACTSVEIFVRETLQNPLDARSDSSGIVEVRYDTISLPTTGSKVASILFPKNSLIHFKSGKALRDAELPEIIDYLVVEDFGTSGLEGCYSDSSLDGPTENWNAFWFREGEGAKPTRSNGGAGQGKITLYTSSAVRTVVAITKRKSDERTLLFGCCRFRQNYKLPGESRRWSKEARLGNTANPEELARPIDAAHILESFKSELKLQRADSAGTSFIVPMPVGLTRDGIYEAVINEFFVPIRRGRLKVAVGDRILDQSTISQAASKLGNAARQSPHFREFLEDAISNHLDGSPTATAKPQWSQESTLSSEHFEATDLEKLKLDFEASKPVSVDFHVRIKKKDSSGILDGIFRVVLKQDLDGDKSHELFVRQDLGIDGEKRLKGSRRIQPVLSLTFIADLHLSEFLAAAEEPTHRNWNAKRPKLLSIYSAPDKTLNAVRNAALRLVELLTPAGRRDETALSAYFADPAAPPTAKRGSAGTSQSSPNSNPLPPTGIPPAKPRPIVFNQLLDGFLLKAVPDEIQKVNLPIEVEVEVAYGTTLGDAFKQWDAADFWLNDEKAFPVHTQGISALVRSGNQISFELDEPDGVFTISGFDSNRQLEVRIKYKEAGDATDIENN